MKVRTRTLTTMMLRIVLAFGILFTGCQNEQANTTTQRGRITETAAAFDVHLEPLPGPKHAIAVGTFEAVGIFRAAYGDWDVGKGFSTMLTHALDSCGRFIVVERANLSQILGEQQLKGQGLIRPNTGAELGDLTGARFLAFGSITEFGSEESGGGFSFGIAGLGGKNLGGAISPSFTKGSVTIDIRVVDTTTGRVVCSKTIRKKIKSMALNFSVNVKNTSFGGNKFNKTPLGKATREAISDAVVTIAQKVGSSRWAGLVVDADAGKVFINAGANAGLKVGDRLEIQRITKQLTDPGTGELLSTVRKTLGTVKVDQIENKVSICSALSMETGYPQRGDMVVYCIQ